MKTYAPRRVPDHDYPEIRGLRYHLTRWGDSDAPTVFMLHGWGDCGGSFQFVVDALKQNWCVIAPDWRGFGLTETQQDTFYFPDYLADLDAIVRHVSGDAPVALVGHSMGGNIASLYAGVFPEKVCHLVNVEGFGLPKRSASNAPANYRRWMESLWAEDTFSTFAGFEQLADRIRKRSPELSPERALYIASLWAEPAEKHTGLIIRAAAQHRAPNPVVYRRSEAQACWSAITAKTCLLIGERASLPGMEESLLDMQSYLGAADSSVIRIADSGHMIHFEQPERLAEALELNLDGGR